jgi:hypothetical protein
MSADPGGRCVSLKANLYVLPPARNDVYSPTMPCCFSRPELY